MVVGFVVVTVIVLEIVDVVVGFVVTVVALAVVVVVVGFVVTIVFVVVVVVSPKIKFYW